MKNTYRILLNIQYPHISSLIDRFQDLVARYGGHIEVETPTNLVLVPPFIPQGHSQVPYRLFHVTIDAPREVLMELESLWSPYALQIMKYGLKMPFPALKSSEVAIDPIFYRHLEILAQKMFQRLTGGLSVTWFERTMYPEGILWTFNHATQPLYVYPLFPGYFARHFKATNPTLLWGKQFLTDDALFPLAFRFMNFLPTPAELTSQEGLMLFPLGNPYDAIKSDLEGLLEHFHNLGYYAFPHKTYERPQPLVREVAKRFGIPEVKLTDTERSLYPSYLHDTPPVILEFHKPWPLPFSVWVEEAIGSLARQEKVLYYVNIAEFPAHRIVEASKRYLGGKERGHFEKFYDVLLQEGVEEGLIVLGNFLGVYVENLEEVHDFMRRWGHENIPQA